MEIMKLIRRDFKDCHSMIQTKRVLVVEDDGMLRKMIEKFLAVNYYQAVAVSDGLDGLRAVLKEDFDFIISDMVMPKLAGDSFYLSVRKIKPHLCSRFIFITGYAENVKINNFIKRVNGTVLYKPFQMEDLLEAVTTVQVRNPSSEIEHRMMTVN
jgi:DNA-binding response OmpR family regulator